MRPSKFLQSDQITLSCPLLAQNPRQYVLAALERCYAAI